MLRTIATTVWGLLLLCTAEQWLHFYPLMQPVMASHFDGAGRPNGWMTRGGFFTLQLFITVLLHGIFIGVPALLRSVPSDRINLPHRDYWLAPGRRTEALQKFQALFLLFGCVLFTVMVAVSQLALQANLENIPLPATPVWALLSAVFLFLPVWLFLFYRAFRLPD